MESLETLIGFAFADRALLEEALTHASLANKARSARRSNQRLEFLGDAVLQLTLSELLYRLWPQADEGFLTKARARLVSTTALARLARGLQLGSHLAMDRAEEANGGRDRDSILADALEALAGAVYLDAGLDACSQWLARLFAEEVARLQAEPGDDNPKGQLQERLQGINREAPTYHLLAAAGPDHLRVFEVEVRWNGRSLGKGKGRSKKEAETAAARQAWLTVDKLCTACGSSFRKSECIRITATCPWFLTWRA